MKTVLALFLLVALVLSVGCSALDRKSDFHISVSNRTSHTILFYANGIEQGPVGAGRAEAFVISLVTISSGGYTAPSPTAQATFTARDVVSGKLSREKPAHLTQDRPYNVEFAPYDFQ